MEASVEQVKEEKSAKLPIFLIFYITLCSVLCVISARFLIYVWNTIELYENTRPEYLIESVLMDFEDGMNYEVITYPKLSGSEFSNMNVIKEEYQDILQTADLNYRFVKEDYQTGDCVYYIYAEEDLIGKLTLEIASQEQRLGILNISNMRVKEMEPVLDIRTWDYEIYATDKQKVYVNDTLVSEEYLIGNKKTINEYEYLYEYVDMPQIVTYRVEGLYEEAQIRVIDENGQEVSYEQTGNSVDATKSVKTKEEIPQKVLEQVNVLKAAQTWSLFTTRDLIGPSNGLAQVQSYFIKDSYYWKKLGEYGRGIDITLVSNHNPANTYFTDEAISEYISYTPDCFSVRIQFVKHMLLSIGRKQLDETDSIFYFVRIDDTDDGKDNPQWKIADIQAVVNQ